MTYAELVQAVLGITKRPDQLALTESAVRASVLKAHTKDFYYKDLVEVAGQVERPSHLTSLTAKEVVPRFRKVKYITPWHYDPRSRSLGCAGQQLKVIQLGNEVDAYGYYKDNVFYMAGELLQIRTSFPLSHFLIGAFQFPDTTPTGFKTWIADECPEAIVHEAARQVLSTVGMRELAAVQQQLAAEQYALLTINNLATAGE